MSSKGLPQENDLFCFKKLLGQGSFGKVYKAIDKASQQYAAVKVIDKTRVEDLNYEQLRAESDILKELNHPNIVKLHNVHETETFIYIVMELIDGGKLSRIMAARRNKAKTFSMME
mmetsp:Transcript_25779/g.29689  ORF Transcript_25779/g.29689 Transcript_25779/m.29689 type:complete len:116 (+) Transcript_25779:13-360(+)